jgi:hypothetical protein
MLGESGAFIKWIRNPADPMPEFPADDIPDAQAESLYKYINAVWGKPGEDEHKHSKETRDHSDAEADQAGTRVGMPDLKFEPAQVSIKAGESVRWENTSDVQTGIKREILSMWFCRMGQNPSIRETSDPVRLLPTGSKCRACTATSASLMKWRA